MYLITLLLGKLTKWSTSTVHILSLETDNCPSWISGRESITQENIPWSNIHERMLLTRWGMDNCPSWISGRERITQENISWSNIQERMLLTQRGMNPHLLITSWTRIQLSHQGRAKVLVLLLKLSYQDRHHLHWQYFLDIISWLVKWASLAPGNRNI